MHHAPRVRKCTDWIQSHQLTLRAVCSVVSSFPAIVLLSLPGAMCKGYAVDQDTATRNESMEIMTSFACMIRVHCCKVQMQFRFLPHSPNSNPLLQLQPLGNKKPSQRTMAFFNILPMFRFLYCISTYCRQTPLHGSFLSFQSQLSVHTYTYSLHYLLLCTNPIFSNTPMFSTRCTPVAG